MSEGNTRIAFCITCKGRLGHLQQTLPKNLADNKDYPNAVFVLLSYGSKDGLDRYIYEHHRHDIESGRLVFYKYTQPGPFRMAHAKNMAHRIGMMEGASVLVNLDADNFTGHGFAAYLNEKFANRSDMFMWSRMVREGLEKLGRGVSGRIAVTRDQFLNVGGYDEKYATWGPDDKDFNTRLRRLQYVGEEIDRRYLNVILHNDKMRFREYPHIVNKPDDSCGPHQVDPHNTVVNFGRIGCGVVYRNFMDLPIQISPVPTRIFGIGMHKTSTTSLHTALAILGYQSAHWKSAHWAKAIWNEMKADGRSLTLERSYALCDLPIPLLFKELDEAYPGSKFILTIRGEGEWLESVRKHWSPDNPFRSAWSKDPFTHKIHREIYGTKGFDSDVFLARYRKHNADVMEYFKHRENDLLVMDMSQGAGWYELCGFLVNRVPLVPYPRSNELKVASHG